MAQITDFNAYKNTNRPSENRQFVTDYLADIAVDIFRSIDVEATQENIADFANGFCDCLLAEVNFTGVIENYCFKDFIETVEEVAEVRQDKSFCYCMGFTYWLYYCNDV